MTKNAEDLYTFLLESQWWSTEKITQYQNEQVRKLIKHAYEHVPYYKNLMNGLDLKPEDIQSTKDLIRLSYLSKDIISSQSENLLAVTHDEKEIRKVSTGGTTGTPLQLYRNRTLEDPKEKDFIFHLWSRKGIKKNDRGAVLTGNKFAGKDADHRFKESVNILFFSSPMVPESQDWDELYHKLLSFEPTYLRGYPSIIAMFSKYLLDNNLNAPPSIKAVFYSSENLYEWQRKYISEAFNIRPLGLYGQSERTVMAGGCEYSSDYHVIPEYGFIELVDENGNLITEPNITGEIVATSFINYTMPFIRYRTGDLSHYSDKKCECGRNHLILPKIDGRTREFVIDEDSNKILFGPSIYGDLWKLDNLFKQVQFSQNQKGRLKVKVVPIASADTITTHFLDSLSKSTGRLSFEIEFVEKVEKTTAGKQPLFIQNMKEL